MLHSQMKSWVGLGVLGAWLHLPIALAQPATNEGRAVAALALPQQPDPAMNRLFSALWNLPAGLAVGPVAELRQRGGSLQVRSDHRGLVVVAEGPPHLPELVARAAQQFAVGTFEARLLPRAKAAVLKSDALAHPSPSSIGEAKLWEMFYGETTSADECPVEDLSLLRLQASDVEAFQRRLQGQEAIFYADGNQHEAKSYNPAAPTPQAGPRLVRLETLGSGAPRLWVGQALPPLPALRGPTGHAWTESLQNSLVDLDAVVRIAFRPASALLIVELPVRDSPPEDLLETVSDRLGKVGAPLPKEGANPSVSATTPEEIIAHLRTQAENQLLFGRGPAEMSERLWREAWGLVLIPEAMRAVTLSPASAH